MFVSLDRQPTPIMPIIFQLFYRHPFQLSQSYQFFSSQFQDLLIRLFRFMLI